MCLVLDQFLWGHLSRVCDISCCCCCFVVVVVIVGFVLLFFFWGGGVQNIYYLNDINWRQSTSKGYNSQHFSLYFRTNDVVKSFSLFTEKAMSFKVQLFSTLLAEQTYY